MLAAVLFDLDNTLIDRQAAHRLYCMQFTEQYLTQWSPDARQLAIEEMIEYDQFGYTPRHRYFEWIVERFQLAVTPEMLWRDYRNRLPRLFPVNQAVCGFVKRLAKRYPTAIVSNGSSQSQRRKLARTGLANLCSLIVISGEVGVEKPDPAIFRLALDSLNCHPETVLFVGDDPHGDIAGAANLGMQTCWIRLGRSGNELRIDSDLQVDHVLELENLLLE